MAAYLEQLTSHLDKMRITSAKAQRVFLEEETPQTQAALYEAQEALALWQASNELAAPPKAAEALTQSLTTLQAQLTEAQVSGRTATRTAEESAALLREQAEYVVATRSEQANPLLSSLAAELTHIEQKLAEEQTFHAKLSQHPDVQRLLVRKGEVVRQLESAQEQTLLPASVGEARNPVREETLKRLLAARVEEQAQHARAQGLQNALAEGRRQMQRLSWSSLEYARLYEDVQLRQAVHETLVKQYQTALLAEKAEEPSFYILDPPTEPWRKSGPRLSVNAGLGLVVGLLIGLLWAAAQERQRRLSADPRQPREEG